MRRAGAAIALAAALGAYAHPGEAPPRLAFAPPPAGSYRLPAIQQAPEGEVLDDSGYFRPLSDYTRGRITLLGLVYTRCTDPDGCPRASWAFREVRALLRADAALQARVRLVTLSFDPVHDSPEVLAAYAARSRSGSRGADWHFVTTASTRRVAPILEGFGQDLGVAADSREGPGSQAFTHHLKVFLIDANGFVREIYSTAYLMPQMVVNDIRTLEAEQRPTLIRIRR